MTKQFAMMLAVVTAAGSASAGDIPLFETETSGNSFRQKWIQPRHAGFQPSTFIFELVSGPADFFIKNVEFPRSNDGFAMERRGEQWIGFGTKSSRSVRFDLVFDSVVGTYHSSSQDFAWKITYVNEDGLSLSGFEWRNYNRSGAISNANGGSFFRLPSSQLSQLTNIPLPTSGAMTLAGIAGLGVTRRRRSA